LSVKSRGSKAIVAEHGFRNTLDLETFMVDDVLVSVIDDDESVRESIPDLLRTFGFHVRAFDSAEAFLASDVIEVTRCLVLDVAMPGMSGPELFEQLKQRPKALPVIFITAQRNGDLCQRLVARGAAACLYKPFDPMALVGAVKHVVP
jgi:FixJ family two-component response regulator